jgi:hypothetical protein
MTYYAALDVGLRAVALCIIDKAGMVRLERSLPSEISDIVDCLRGFGEEITCVGLEARSLTQSQTGPLGFPLAAGCLRKELVAAKYSSAGAVIPPPRWPTAIVASEDSRVHTGVMAAGARSGAIVAMGGTSVAAPQMARLLADSLVGGPPLSFTPLAGVPAERAGAGLLATPIFRPKRYE